MKIKVFKQSLLNLNKSANELSYYISFLNCELLKLQQQIIKSNFLNNDIKELAIKYHNSFSVDILDIFSEIQKFKHSINNTNSLKCDDQEIEYFILKKKYFYERLRTLIPLYSVLHTFLNWQSPSIKSSKNTRLGIEKYKIQGDYNDYKRDRSGDTFYCEKQLQTRLFSDKCINIKPIFNLFNCGMAAFTSILYFLIGENIIKNKILFSLHAYIENTIILNKIFKNKIETFDFNNAELIIKKIYKLKPDVVFIDVISNTFKMPLFDARSIIQGISEVYSNEILFVVDVTCCVGYENFLDGLRIPKNVKIIMHGSILKAPQLGMERVNAGFSLSFGLDNFISKVADYRTLSGSTIQDFAGYLLPVTTSHCLRDRLKIIEENIITIANFLMVIDTHKLIFKEIIYPGLKNHPDFEISKRVGFAGPFMNIRFKESLNKDKYFELFTVTVLRYAKKYNCDIIHGASYGFNETSIYYSVGWDNPEDHYLRISMGTETVYEIEKIKQVFYLAYKAFKNKYLKV